MTIQLLAAFRVTRSRIGLAVFANEKVEFARCLNLPFTSHQAAINSLRNLLGWVLEQFSEPVLAVERTRGSPDINALADEISRLAQEHNLPLVSVQSSDLFGAYSVPVLKSRDQLRTAAGTIWPGLVLLKRKEILDAAALGLYVQTHHLLGSPISPNN